MTPADTPCVEWRGVNLEHLRLGTQSENVAESYRKGRAIGSNPFGTSKTHCPAGHAYSPDNTAWRNGKRKCRACHRATQRRYLARRAARSV